MFSPSFVTDSFLPFLIVNLAYVSTKFWYKFGTVFPGCQLTVGNQGARCTISVQPDCPLSETSPRISIQEATHLERGQNSKFA